MLKTKWTTCSKCDDRFRLDTQHNQEDLYDHLMNTSNFTLIVNKIFICALKITRKGLYPQFGFTNHLILIACFISGLVGKSYPFKGCLLEILSIVLISICFIIEILAKPTRWFYRQADS